MKVSDKLLNAKSGVAVTFSLVALLLVAFNSLNITYYPRPELVVGGGADRVDGNERVTVSSLRSSLAAVSTLTEYATATYFNKSLDPPAIILQVKGGIGNQLFQYACHYALSRELGWPLYIYSPLTENYLAERKFNKFKREFALDHFQIPLTNLIDSTTKFPQVFYFSDEVLYSHDFPKGFDFIQQLGTAYCQSEVYWGKYKEKIRQMFHLKTNLLSLNPIQQLINQIQSAESVAVHVRRGDFLQEATPGFYVPLSFQRAAIRRMISMLEAQGKKKLTFFVFSDHITHVQRKLKDFHSQHDFVYVTNEWNTTSIQDLYLMTLCKNIIVPNSTFSWWAAYLNENQGKVVIASAFNPKFWSEWARLKEHIKLFYMRLHGQMYHPKEWVVIDTFSGEV